ncbi:hypothetical protein ASD24_00620 [Paenibacillus sp. Root52]|uniref:Uncharacterized protein n=1 Tax=Paenibacillus amylolyticus TaxID=1451 RepID=A0AAP5GWL8_PAEAM|nr:MULTISPECIES: hypothetical protein [Paenibacillus]KQY94103.1 hypothetical protein ASD24_00620 [Paenibacillus sp. Root52]MDR6721928.1 hypothetical protein [Paenibacillus amylolyticus]
MKFILPLVLAIVVVIGIIVVLQSSTSNKKSNRDEPFNTNSHILHIIKNEALAGTSSIKLINIPAEFNYVKIDFINSGTKPFTFTINHGSNTGNAAMSGTIPADGKIHTFSNEKSWSAGEYYLNVSSAQKMSAAVDVDLLKRSHIE